MVFWVIVQIAVAVAFLILSYALQPKPPRQRPPQVRQLEDPTADAGRPVPVVFGTVLVTSPNLLYIGFKGKYTYEIGARQPPNPDDNPDVVPPPDFATSPEDR